MGPELMRAFTTKPTVRVGGATKGSSLIRYRGALAGKCGSAAEEEAARQKNRAVIVVSRFDFAAPLINYEIVTRI